MINIRHISVKCGRCGTYQTLCHFHRRAGWHVYTYECENEVCEAAQTRTLIEIPADLDEFARRDPKWHEGAPHSGAEVRGRRGEADPAE